jgi:hypothetical protein
VENGISCLSYFGVESLSGECRQEKSIAPLFRVTKSSNVYVLRWDESCHEFLLVQVLYTAQTNDGDHEYNKQLSVRENRKLSEILGDRFEESIKSVDTFQISPDDTCLLLVINSSVIVLLSLDDLSIKLTHRPSDHISTPSTIVIASLIYTLNTVYSKEKKSSSSSLSRLVAEYAVATIIQSSSASTQFLGKTTDGKK